MAGWRAFFQRYSSILLQNLCIYSIPKEKEKILGYSVLFQMYTPPYSKLWPRPEGPRPKVLRPIVTTPTHK